MIGKLNLFFLLEGQCNNIIPWTESNHTRLFGGVFRKIMEQKVL